MRKFLTKKRIFENRRIFFIVSFSLVIFLSGYLVFPNLSASATLVPTVTGMSPFSAVINSSGFTMTVNGTNFVSNSVVRFNGSNRTTTFVSSTRLTASIPASDLTSTGTKSITVFTSGGGTSNTRLFAVGNPVPTTTSISPTFGTVGLSGFKMTIYGTGFVPGSKVGFNGSNRTTTYVSPTQLTASILTSDITSTGNFSITVYNSNLGGGGGTSNAQTFTMNNPVFSIAEIIPSSVTIGASGFTMTIYGTNFVSGSIVKFNGSNRTTAFVSSTRLTASIPASDLTTAGTFSIIVYNPGGGNTNPQTLAVTNPVPTTTSISPTSGIVGSAGFTMTVNGTNFVSNSVVRFNDSNRTTTFVSSTKLTASIPASDLTGTGSFGIDVYNPSPIGGTSIVRTFTVSRPALATTSISPSSARIGDSGFIMTVNGIGFVPGSVVRFNGSDRTTTYISPTQLTASILASDLNYSSITVYIYVFNPGPNGGNSNAQVFTVNYPAPTITSTSPTSALRNSSGFTMTIYGTNFLSNSVVEFGGSNRTTTYISPTQLTASILASDLTTVGYFGITVFNSNGGTSNLIMFGVIDPAPIPTITNISPISVAINSNGFTMTVNGIGFVPGSVVRFNGSNKTTTYISPTQLTASILTSDLTTADTFLIFVYNPPPGGGYSNAQMFIINAQGNSGSINCGSNCSGNYNYGNFVALTALAATGSTFTGWSGDCDANGQVTMTGAKTCIATFTLNTYSLTVTKSGSGSVTAPVGTGDGINCGTNCSENYNYNTLVTLTATPSGSTFTGWSGACSGTAITCTVTMTAAKTVTATFTASSCSLPWGGTIASGSSVTAYSASSVACGSTCSSQSRTCTNGILGGNNSYNKETCSVTACVPTVDLKVKNSFIPTGSDGPVSIAYNSAATLFWTSTNATACTASGGWSGTNKATNSSGESTGNLTNSKTYTLTCTGSGGSATDSVIVNVGAPGLSASLSATPPSGTAPLNEVALTTDVSGSAIGTINYTFYCNRSDTRTNITSGYIHKADGTNTDPYTAPAGACNSVYQATGAYTAKVIAERAGVATEARTTITVTNPPQTLTVNKTGTGSGSVNAPVGIGDGVNCGTNCSENYNYSTSVTLTATASTGSTFTGWSGACSGTAITCTVTMTAAKNVTATFTAIAPPVTTLRGRSPSGSGSFANGPISIGSYSSVELSWSATNGATGCTASGGWSGAKAASGTQTINSVNADTTFSLYCTNTGGNGSTVSFAVRILTVSLSASPASGNAPLNNVSLTATIAGTSSGTYRYFFDCTNDGTNESDTGNIASNPYTASNLCSYSAAGTYTAKVTAWHNSGSAVGTATVTVTNPPQTLTVTKSGSGTVTPSAGTLSWSGNTGTATYNHGTSITLTAAADSGSGFTNWLGACSGTASTCTVTMTAAKSVTATFNLGTYAINYTATNGSVTPTSCTYSTTVTPVCTPNTGYITTSCPAVFTCSTSNSKTATFVAKTLAVSLTASPSTGAGSLTSTLTANVTGTASGSTNYAFWWNCNETTTNIANAITACGSLPTPISGTCVYNSVGAKCDGMPPTSGDAVLSLNAHTYSTVGKFYPKVIVERDNSVPNATDKKTVEVTNQAPTAINLTATQPNYCKTGPAATLSWNFSDPDIGDTQGAYQVQVATNPGFSGPGTVIDSCPTPSTGTCVQGTVSNTYFSGSGKLVYNQTYYWRVKVWDNNDTPSADWVVGASFTTPKHVYPTVSFKSSPLNPSANEVVQLTDQTTGGATINGWTWSIQDAVYEPGSNDTSQNPKVKFSSTGTKTIILTAKDANGYQCTNADTASSKQNIQVRLPLPGWKEVAP